MSGIRRGHIVEVHFLDHVQGGARPMRCVVYGVVHSISKISIVVDSWMLSGAGKATAETNAERFTIVRSAVTAVYRLRREAQ